MGAFSKRAPIEIKDQPGWEKHEVVLIKGGATTADVDAQIVADRQGHKIQSMLERFIVRWTFTDDNGKRVDLSPISIAQLDTTYTLPIALRIDGLMERKMTVEEQTTFLGNVSPGSAETPT